MSVDPRQAVKVRVTGRVQGVGFRAWVRDEAARLGLDGWVRNADDGAVTALIAGPKGEVEALIALLRRGPPAALVAGVSVVEAPGEHPPPGFLIAR